MGSGRARGRRVHRARLIGAVATLAALVALTQVPLTSAAFTARTSTPSSSFTAANSFCTAPGSITRNLINDTWANQNDPTRNYGGDTHLNVIARAGQRGRVFIRPDLPTIPARCRLTSAILTLDEHGIAARTLDIYRVDEAWDVGTLNWNNQPTVTGTPVSGIPTAVIWEIDVRALIQDLYDSGTNHGLMIQDRTENTATFFENRFHSLDDADEKPYIVYTYA